jgi:DNA-binding transcriptional regulator YiaG
MNAVALPIHNVSSKIITTAITFGVLAFAGNNTRTSNHNYTIKHSTAQNPVARKIHTLKELASFTDSEIAQLLHTSRQTLHNWKSGKNISSKRSYWLNKVLTTIKIIRISTRDAQSAKTLIFETKPGQISIFDFIVQGMTDEALEMFHGVGWNKTITPQIEPISTQFSLIENIKPSQRPKLSNRFSSKFNNKENK